MGRPEHEPARRPAAASSMAIACADVPALPLSIAPPAIEGVVAALAELLRRFSPAVEPAAGEPGTFWLDASGLARLFPSPAGWARAIHAALAAAGHTAYVAVGWSRFGVYAAARSRPRGGVLLLADAEAERRAARRVALARLGIDDEARVALERLGVRTVAELVRLPAAGIQRRFGAAIYRLHRLATGVDAPPLAPASPPAPFVAALELDDPEPDRERLGFLLKRLLDPLLGRLATRGLALAALHVGLRIGRSPPSARPLEWSLRPAAPTLDAVQLMGLVRLRLERLAVERGVVAVRLLVDGVPATRTQLELFAVPPRRDPAAAARALARVRAAFGEDAVVRARAGSGHLPEASFAWEPIDRPRAQPRPRAIAPRPIVRRVLAAPLALPPRPRREPDGWMPRGAAGGAVVHLDGPFVLSGGWWRREIERDYYFAELRGGAVLWLYYDRVRRTWFLHGEVA